MSSRSRCRLLSALSAALLLAACSPPAGSVWSKEGATPQVVRQDQKACVAEADDYRFLGPTPGQTGSTLVASQQQGDLYRACMVGKGYSPHAPQDAPQASN